MMLRSVFRTRPKKAFEHHMMLKRGFRLLQFDIYVRRASFGRVRKGRLSIT
jgi:hypothetical protein